jgi:Lrp/AsnC family transcriptional regulator, regulator for asnA, asnC and gidA
MQPQLDDIDIKLIDRLGRDSSTTFVELARQIGISDATVNIRVRRLMSEGVIKKFTISLDYDLLGYDHLAFVGINIKPSVNVDATIDKLVNLEEVLELYEMHNSYDVFLKIRAKDFDHLRDIVENKIRALPNILNTELIIALKSRKEKQIVRFKSDYNIQNKK